MTRHFQFFAIVSSCLLITVNAIAQDDSPVTSLDQINKAVAKISEKYLAYMSTVAHNNNKVKKAQKKRDELLSQIIDSRAAVMGVPGYKGDKSLKEATIEYLNVTNHVMNDNLEKVINLEEIAEKSYDNMEAYILMQKAVNDKIDEANEKRRQQLVAYCKKYNIQLVETMDEMSLKMKKVNEVNDYQNLVYLVFFKAAAQENDLMEALSKKNITALEQLRNSLTKYSDEGLTKLDTLKGYAGDMLLKGACRSALEFFKYEADKMTIVTDYYLKTEAFEKIKQNFESNPGFKSNKEEIDKYNKTVNELNQASKQYNQTNQQLNDRRKRAYDNWNNAVNAYMDRNVPYAK